MPAPLQIGPENTKTTVDTVSPSNVQLPSATVAPQMEIPDNASTLTTLRMVILRKLLICVLDMEKLQQAMISSSVTI